MTTKLSLAKTELELAGLFSSKSDYEGMLGEAVLELLIKFEEQGHSGASASMVCAIFTKLVEGFPLTPLTGAETEWEKAWHLDGVQQNKRCSRVFRRPDGVAYDIEAKVFREPNGTCYTSALSRATVTFPYTPKTEIIDVGFGREPDLTFDEPATATLHHEEYTDRMLLASLTAVIQGKQIASPSLIIAARDRLEELMCN